MVEDDLRGFTGITDFRSLWQILSLVFEVTHEDVDRPIRREFLNSGGRGYRPFSQKYAFCLDEHEVDGLASSEHGCLCPGVAPLRFRDAERWVFFDLE